MATAPAMKANRRQNVPLVTGVETILWISATKLTPDLPHGDNAVPISGE